MPTCFLIAAAALAQPAVQETSDTLQDMLLTRAASVQPPLEQQVLSFYLARDFAPAWTDSQDVMVLRKALARAADQGLTPLDYAVHQAPDAARDLALTEALFHYAHDVRVGRLRPRSVYKDAQLSPRDFDPGPALARALANHGLQAFLDSLPPHHPGYIGLATALARYRAIAALGGWARVAGDKDLGRRLIFEDANLAANSTPSDEDVRAALKRYQARNGLADDGKLSPDTLQQLNIPVATRIRQIAANMERWRWLPDQLERRRVEVNVPDQSLDVMEGNDVALHSRVIIGKRTTPTPILRTAVIAVVVNPSWDIPDDIATRQLLPRLRKDADYLAARNMTLVDAPPDATVNWRKVAGTRLPYQIRQPPGPDNALGQLMLDSPNDFDVYMHDTPGKALFEKDKREASNGCIRVEQIHALTVLALGDGKEDVLDDAIAAGKTQRMPLEQSLPVYLLYWTALADSDGNVGFRPDRYGRDTTLLARLDN